MSTPTTNPEAIPGFDAVAESRKWREATSRLLGAMSLDERLAYLHDARERYFARRRSGSTENTDRPEREESCVVREDAPNL